MRILFSADLHSDWSAYQAFARALRRHDLGILGGDLMDEFITRAEVEAFGLVAPDTQAELEVLWGEDDHLEVALDAAMDDAVHNPESLNRRGLARKRRLIQDLLNSTGKPVFLIRGNHDVDPWPDEGQVLNLEERRVEFGGLSFVGFNRAQLTVAEDERHSALEALVPLVDHRTIFVSHLPPRAGHEASGPWASGSEGVAAFVNRTRPVWVLCGHIHSNFGRRGRVINGAWAIEGRFVSLNTDTDAIRYLRAPKGNHR